MGVRPARTIMGRKSLVSTAGVISPFYETRPPSPQTIADIFGGQWQSALPDQIVSGAAPLFDDRRPFWLASNVPGGLEGKSVLECGPFEGYQTYLLLKNGAATVVAVESNSVNFLKCLCVKEIYGLEKAALNFGDVVEFLRSNIERYDIVLASGILYHLQDPAYFIRRVCELGDIAYVWTHYFDKEAIGKLRNGRRSTS
jgi:hypothetical protein